MNEVRFYVSGIDPKSGEEYYGLPIYFNLERDIVAIETKMKGDPLLRDSETILVSYQTVMPMALPLLYQKNDAGFCPACEEIVKLKQGKPPKFCPHCGMSIKQGK